MEAEDYYLFGGIISRLDDRETARECWEQGLHIDPNHAGLLFELASLFRRMSRYSAATKLASHLSTQPGWEARGKLLLGQIKYEQDEPEGSSADLRTALDLDQARPGAVAPTAESRKLLARTLLRTGRSTDARSQLQIVLTKGSDPEASWLLSRSYLQARVLVEAATALEQSQGYREEHPLTPEPAVYIGSARCAPCHDSIYKSEQTSLHARTFRRATELKDLHIPDHALHDPAQKDVSHTIRRSAGQVQLETQVHGETYHALVDYAFGSGDQGLTFVGHDQSGRARELRLSYYGDGATWDVTSGQLSQRPTGENFLGKRLSADDVYSCLFCHTTVARSARDQRPPLAADRGIGCERCHGPGGNHLEAVALKFSDRAIARPGPDAGGQVITLCAMP